MEAFDGFFDFDRDGLDDPHAGLTGSDRQGWSYRRMGRDGVPLQASTDLGIHPDETVFLWGDFDEDGRLDRVGRIRGELRLHTGAGTVTAFPNDLGDVGVARVRGDPRVLLAYGEHAIALVRIGARGVVEPMWGPLTGEWWWIAPVVSDDRIDLVLGSPGGDAGTPRDVTKLRIDRATGVVEERVVDHDVRGLLVEDFDGDGNYDFAASTGSRMWFRFGGADGEFGEAHPLPASIPVGDHGYGQAFDLDADGATELLLALPMPDGRRQWQSLQYERCERGYPSRSGAIHPEGKRGYPSRKGGYPSRR
jgi:hypothetical protein